MNQRQQSGTTYPILFFMASSTDHVTAVTGIVPVVTLSKNGGAFGAAAGAVSEIGNGWYALAGNATDRNTLGDLAVHATGTGADPFDGKYSIVPYDPFVKVDANVTSVDGTAASPAPEPYKTGSVNDAAATTTAFVGDAALSATDDFYNGAVLSFTSGDLKGIARKVTDYVGATKTITLGTALPAAPANSVTFIIVGRIE